VCDPKGRDIWLPALGGIWNLQETDYLLVENVPVVHVRVLSFSSVYPHLGTAEKKVHKESSRLTSGSESPVDAGLILG
jgi:hypothetical protein